MGYRKRGKFSYRFECQIDGKRYGRTFHIYSNDKDVITKKYIDWKCECENGNCYGRMTFGEVAKMWLDEQCKPNYSPLVVTVYRKNLDNWILPEFGQKDISDITPFMIQRFLEKLKVSKTKYLNRKNKLLSNGTIEKIYEVLRDIIKYAYRADIIKIDPCTKVKLEPRKEIVPETKHFWDIEEYTKALELLENEPTDNAFVVETALKTGLRRSELFGLTWDDVDLDNCCLSVTKSRQKVDGKMRLMPCKTISSIRKISIPQSLATSLSEFHKKNKNTTFVFENIDYDAATAWYRKWIVRNNLPKIRFHDLRHTHATLLLSQHIDVKTIQKRLGHANITTTLNTYAHVLDGLDFEASEALEKISVK